MGLGDFDGLDNRNLIIGFLRLLFFLAPMCSDSRKVSICGKYLSKLQTHGDTNTLLFRLYELVVSNNLLRLSTYVRLWLEEEGQAGVHFSLGQVISENIDLSHRVQSLCLFLQIIFPQRPVHQNDQLEVQTSYCSIGKATIKNSKLKVVVLN